MVDSNDRERIDIARDELFRVVNDEALVNAKAVLVLANKQDIAGSMSIAEISDSMQLHKLKTRNWFVQGACAVQGEGLYQGLDWLAKQIA